MKTLSVIFSICCSIMISAPAYAMFGISELAAAAITGCCCFAYEHKRIDFTNQRVKKQEAILSKNTIDVQTLASNVSTVANNVNTLASNMVFIANQHHPSMQHDLQRMESPVIHMAPAPLPRAVLRIPREQPQDPPETLPMPVAHE